MHILSKAIQLTPKMFPAILRAIMPSLVWIMLNNVTQDVVPGL
jgi:hypothetical protein